MKKYLKEIIIILLQIVVFYLLPLTTSDFGPMGMVFLLLLFTFILSLIIGFIVTTKFKYFYPGLVSIIFIPTIFIYYNESASIHAIWYLVISGIGLLLGLGLKKIK